MKLGEITISKDHELQLNLLEDFTDTEIRLGDFIRLKGLEVGVILYLKDDGGEHKIILIGNGTPYNGLSTISGEGWDWKLYNNWIVTRVLYLQPNLHGSYLDPGYVGDIKSDNYWGGAAQREGTAKAG